METPKLKCANPNCRKLAKYYGRFAGGACFEHAKEIIEHLYAEDRARLEAELRRVKAW